MPMFRLDPAVTFLNHGSFGAVPTEVEDARRRWAAEMEKEPVSFVIRTLPEALDTALKRAARFVGVDPAGLVFVRNATEGVNAVLASLQFAAGEEVLTTNHRYDAVRNALAHHVERHGAAVVEAEIPFPLRSSDEIFQAVEAAFTKRTRLLVIDWISSPTALILPVARLVAAAHARGIPVLIDGAHAPGQVELQLDTLGADFWVGNLHKWVCAPRGTALLHVSPAWRDRIHPTVISHGYGKGLQAEFGWVGTADPSPWLASIEAMDLHEAMGGPTFRAANHRLVQEGRELLAQALRVELPHPDDPELYGSMATIPLPRPAEQARAIQDRLYDRHRIEVPIVPWGGRAWVRISGFSAYNHASEYSRLARALPGVLGALR